MSKIDLPGSTPQEDIEALQRSIKSLKWVDPKNTLEEWQDGMRFYSSRDNGGETATSRDPYLYVVWDAPATPAKLNLTSGKIRLESGKLKIL